MPDQTFRREFDNGLIVLGIDMPWLSSAAFAIAVPCGAAVDPVDGSGLSHMVCEMVLRGAGKYDNRGFVTALENLGVEWDDTVAAAHTYFSGACVADRLPQALEIFADVLRRPRFDPAELEPARAGILQEIQAIEDEPGDKVMRALRRRFFPFPWGRHALGEREVVENATLDDIVGQFERHYRPNGCLIGIAGKFDWDDVCKHIERLLGDWAPREASTIEDSPAEGGVLHIPYDSHQTHIAVAYPSVPYNHRDYFLARGAVGALSGGMSARLFTEIREKRGLCYSVGASYRSLKHTAGVFCYAGTTADRAQQTLDVLLAELKRLAEGIRPEELQRLKARVKSGLVMQQESSSSRAGNLIHDYYHLGHTRTLDELAALIDGLTHDAINDYLRRNPPGDFTIVTVGPEPLEVSGGVR